ncbi:hypothetical protein FQR65_LT10751 [Abscondita terminalis]|nr:hypothetical protein FQR65_LT10751 [Abscondita terminalis]
MKYTAITSVLIISIGIYLIPKYKNNVCKTFYDYYGNRDKNPNCYFNPDTNLNVSEIIKNRGYPLEIHDVVTDDGYILTTFRIPHGKNDEIKKIRPPIFLQHGVLLNSACFVNRGNKSLAFILADAGYDVWLGNFRGTMYSRRHVSLTDEDKEYWNFDTYELGRYDAGANINIIYKLTKQQVVYLGYSFGSTAGYMYCASFPHIASEKVKIIIGMAPTLYLKEWKNISKYIIPLWLKMQPLALKFTKGEVYIRGKAPSPLRKYVCLPYPIQMYICQFFDMLVAGFDYGQNDPETLPVTIVQNTDATSYRTITHGLQLIQKGTFDYCDYGPELNKAKYGVEELPQYDLSRLSIPTYLIYAKNDMMITKENVLKSYEILLKMKINVYGVYEIKHDDFNHDDFIAARDVVPLLYKPLVEFIDLLYVSDKLE